ncbi:hypothetical protein CEXT_632151 [Caerostris extrusa]|uniref:Uncharacterized protein n=1 Tax=Caerostris extrusa TaxID=172846 RepID=A0AAV4M6B7_CAEEX|nr:hypothetical protein CEXT_632151 [Caerostris extrusa]
MFSGDPLIKRIHCWAEAFGGAASASELISGEGRRKNGPRSQQIPPQIRRLCRQIASGLFRDWHWNLNVLSAIRCWIFSLSYCKEEDFVDVYLCVDKSVVIYNFYLMILGHQL